MIVRRATKADLSRIAEIHSVSFRTDWVHDHDSFRWISSKFASVPFNTYYVAETDVGVIGYILWAECGGVRSNAVLELEQIAVAPEHRAVGTATELILESLAQVESNIGDRHIKLIKVTTGTTNAAQRLYKRTICATPVCVIQDLYDGDEVIMISRR